MEYEDLKKSLEKDYLIVKKRQWWHFLGGALAFLFLAGVVTYQSSVQALKGSSAVLATRAVEKLEVEARVDRNKIGEHLSNSEANLAEMESRLRLISTIEQSLTTIEQSLTAIINTIERGNPWESFSNNIKDVIKDGDKYEYALFRNGDFRTVTASQWSSGWRVMTSPYMIFDSGPFRLGGSAWIWDTADPRDNDGVFHFYYSTTTEGTITRDGNGLTKADEGGEGAIYRRPRK